MTGWSVSPRMIRSSLFVSLHNKTKFVKLSHELLKQYWHAAIFLIFTVLCSSKKKFAQTFEFQTFLYVRATGSYPPFSKTGWFQTDHWNMYPHSLRRDATPLSEYATYNPANQIQLAGWH